MRTIEGYERDGDVFWLGELPEHEAVETALAQGTPTADAPLLVARRVAVREPPRPPEQLQPWLDGDGGYTDPERPPALRESRRLLTVGGPLEGETVWREDFPDVESVYRSWRRVWDGWAAKDLHDRPARKLYKELFAAHTVVTSQPEEYELILGVGCLAWAPSDHAPVRRHVLTTTAVITFDESTGTLAVVAQPTLDALAVELDMLDPARRPAPQHINEVVERARVQEAHPLARTETGDLARRVTFALDPDGRYDDVDVPPRIGVVPVVAFAPAILLRRRSRLGLIDVFERISAAIATTGVVPAGLLPLLDPDHPPTVEPDPTPGAIVDVDEEAHLPLPLNAEQLEIIRRVDRQAQTLVQGPPGTGKTHLAAALIAHLLAQGKRVLVTAQTDRALKEVRAKLPEEIRPLAVAVVGTDRSDMADLKVAVERISSRSNEGDPQTLEARTRDQVEAALTRIDELRRRRAELRQRLLEAREGDVAERSFAGYSGTLATIAQQYHEHAEDHRWLLTFRTPDVETQPPLSGDAAVRWLELLRDTDLVDQAPEASRRLIDLTTVPAPEQFAEILDRQTAAKSGFAAVADWSRHPAFDAVRQLDVDTRSDLQQRMTELARQISGFENRREPWMEAALADLRTSRGSTWAARSVQIETLLAGAFNSLEHLAPATTVTVAEGTDRAALEALAQHLRDHVNEHGPVKVNHDGSVKVGAFAGKAVKTSQPLFDAVRVNGRQPVTVDQLTTVLLTFDIAKHLDALDRAWPTDMAIPDEDTPHGRFNWHVAEWRLLQSLLSVGQELATEHQRFEALGLPHPDWSDLDSVLAYARLVDVAAAYDVYENTTSPLRRLAEVTAAVCRWGDAAEVCSQLDDAVRRRDRAAYAAAHQRTRWLYTVRQLVAERDALTAHVTVSAPDLARAVTSTPHDDVWTRRLPALSQAWDWARVGVWILGRDTEDANELLRQLDVADEALRGVIERLAAVRAWAHALAHTRLTGQARADLSQYVQLVKRFGKTGGKFAAARQSEIRTVMNRCRAAVPVWIMPIYRIADQFPVTENMFDVVIVDEASQAGLEATFLQYLAPRIVVIGDDKQVSPSAVGIEQQPLRDLAHQYLSDSRYVASWQDPKVSLFDAANIWFGAKKTLIEHRRCVPEIIGFSNRIAYEPDGIKLVPVRQFGADRLDPVKPVHVPDGYEAGTSGSKVNLPEAEAIVEQIEKCLADPRYEGKTFGVISLLGPRQAKVINDTLLERLPPEEWSSRDLRCGDAAAFQGSERDVMFLSMVSAPEPGQRMGAMTLEANVQRYNVAASRAKDQMWVFHTVRLDQLTKVEDMRFALLDYCYHGVQGLRVDSTGQIDGFVPEDRRVDPFDSLFEQRVHNRIVERGYTVIPQYDTMGYRIDLVVVGAKGRLAVECDGDHWHGPEQYLRDLARERDLRRCDWEFFRVRESTFYVDGHSVLSQLWARLDEREIRPSGWSEPFPGDDEAPATPPAEDDAGIAPDVGSRNVAERGTEDGENLDQDELIEDHPGWDTTADEDDYGDDLPAKPWDHQLGLPVPPRSGGRPAPTPARRVGDVPPPASASTSAGLGASLPGAALRSYEEYEGSAPPALESSWGDVAAVVEQIVAVEGPVLGSRVQAAYVAASGGRRVGPAIAQRLNGVLDMLVRKGAITSDDPLDRKGIRLHTFRLPTQPIVLPRVLGPRDLDEVPPRELAALLRATASATGWTDHEALFREVLRRLDRVRLTTGVRKTLAAVLPLARD